jgi:hypothetical protein
VSRGLIAWLDDEALIIDGKPYEWLPRAKQWAGRTVYLVRGSMPVVARDYITSADEASGPKVGVVSSIAVSCGKAGWWTLRGADAWGLPDEPESARTMLAEMALAVADEGLPWRDTVSSVAGTLGRRAMPDLGRRGTRCGDRWEPMWREAVHPGPMVALRGGAAYATQLDRQAAYLNALETAEIPETYDVAGPEKWTKLRKLHGVVTAVVEVDRSLTFGPLPCRTHGLVLWPVGRFVGSWSIRWLRWAEERGATVVSVVDSAAGRRTTPLRPVFEAMAAVRHPKLRKLLYQRWWSRWNSRGWFTATVDGPGEGIRKDRPLVWHEPREPQQERRRPEVSADIACVASLPVVEAVQAYGPRSCLAHVDAVWVDGEAPPPPGWTVKSTGPLRVWGVGSYEHGDRIGAQGSPPGMRGEALRAWLRRRGGRGMTSTLSRDYRSGNPGESVPGPWISEDVTSSPPVVGVPDDGVSLGFSPTWQPEGHRTQVMVGPEGVRWAADWRTQPATCPHGLSFADCPDCL